MNKNDNAGVPEREVSHAAPAGLRRQNQGRKAVSDAVVQALHLPPPPPRSVPGFCGVPGMYARPPRCAPAFTPRSCLEAGNDCWDNCGDTSLLRRASESIFYVLLTLFPVKNLWWRARHRKKGSASLPQQSSGKRGEHLVVEPVVYFHYNY